MTSYLHGCRAAVLLVFASALAPVADARADEAVRIHPDRQARRAAPEFAQKPKVAKLGDKHVITFACKAACDATVAIVDRDGRIVRHLASGVLGENAPEPFAKEALTQRIEWDGKDDDGKPAGGGPFTARVGLGLKVAHDGPAFAKKGATGPNRLEGISGLAAGPDGRLYVMSRWAGLAWWSSLKIHVFRRDGSYEKTIKPYSPSLPPAKLKEVGAFVNSFGAVNPLIYRAEGTAFYPQEEVPQQPAITPDGQIVLATRSSISDYMRSQQHLALLDGDGGVPTGGYKGPALGMGWAPNPCLAVGSDGKTVYIVGMRRSRGRLAEHAVYRVKLPGRGPLERVFGDPGNRGDDKAHLNGPRGVAVDGKGHLLVADYGNDRVVVLREKDHSFVGSFAVKAPSWVAVNPKTGAAYVCSEKTQVIKFTAPRAGFKGAKEQSRVDFSFLLKPILARRRARTSLYFALDHSAAPATLWAGCASQLVRCLDRGDRFTKPVSADCKATQFFWRPTADPAHRLVACRITDASGTRLHILDEAAGTVRVLAGDVAGRTGRSHRLGPDGSIYGQDHALGLIRYDRDGKLKPFEATAKDAFLKGRLPVGATGTTLWERDFWVDRKNDIYVRARGTTYHGKMSMHVYDQQGRFKRTVLWAISDGMFGPRVDAQGNLYIMEIVKPLGQPYPDEFKGRITGKGRLHRYAPMHWYDWIYGSIVKFGPAGGAVWFKQGPLSANSPLDYEGWRGLSSNGRVTMAGLKTTAGSLTAKIVRKPTTLHFPWPSTMKAAAVKKISFRLKNASGGTRATLGWHIVGERYATPASTQSVEIKPNSDFTEYTFDVSGHKDWKEHVYNLSLVPTDVAKGSFHIDWVRVNDEGKPGSRVWNFNAEDSASAKLPATMKKVTVGAYRCPKGAELQGAIWMRPGFGHVGQCGNNDHCHCAGTDFDLDNFGRIFAPDTGRFRVGVLDTNGNEILSFGGYGNQDHCGPDSYVIDPATKLLRPRKRGDPKDLSSPFAKPRIAFGWIIGVAVTDRYVYVDDLINKRILRIRLGYAATETLPLP